MKRIKTQHPMALFHRANNNPNPSHTWVSVYARITSQGFLNFKIAKQTLAIKLLLILLITAFIIPMSAQAKRKVEQYNLPQPQSYKNYELRVEASTRRPQIGKPVILKAIISPEIDPKKIEYQFLINGAPIPEPGMHKVHTFEETGTYKVSAVAKLGGSYLLNSPPIIVHVIDSWIEPEAVISPAVLTVQPGEDAIFTSHSETAPESRQWLYWSISSGHRGSGDKFIIKTNKLKVGKYPIELLVKDDRNRESIANAHLIITDSENEVETLTLDASGNIDNTIPDTNNSVRHSLQLRTSHTNRLEGMQVIFWIQNAQPGADTELQLDSGDGEITPWSKKLRYGHRYAHFGIYTATISSRSPNSNLQSNTVTVYVWPLWLPVMMVILGLLLAGIPFFKRRQRQQIPAKPIIYQHQPSLGQHQLILTSDQETPAVRICHDQDTGQQVLTVTEVASKSDAIDITDKKKHTNND